VANEAGHEVTQLLAAARQGREGAADQLLELVYGQLRAIAGHQMVAVPAGGTLQPTALVHEAYLRLFGGKDVRWEDRRQFFGAAARAMRDLVIEQARRHATAKRGGGRKRVNLENALVSTQEQADELLALDEAMQQLAAINAESAEVVMLRYFAGMTVPETAEVLGISPSTVDRHWRYARAWLRPRVRGDGVVDSEEDATP
jgi:RNA polymerase sigma factor (TIGR02999 family)